MRLTTIFFLATCLQVTARTEAQSVTLKLTNAPLQEVFREIQKQTGLNIMVDAALLEKTARVTIDVRNKPVAEVLALCLRNEPLSYTIMDGRILVKSSHPPPALPPSAPPAAPAAGDIHGQITDSLGNPLGGVSVIVKKSGRGTETAANGRFSLSGLPENTTIEISAVGYAPITLHLADGKLTTSPGRPSTEEARSRILNGSPETLLIRLVKSTSRLDEVQIIAYGQQSQRLSTGNVTVVKAEDIDRQPVNNPLLALQARVPGMIVTQANGLPGAGVSILIRGKGSISASTDPLYIIDGLPYDPNAVFTLSTTAANNESPFISINPADIESISVLKDADATAIYGSRGANGVILITTKKAKPGKTALGINLQSGISEVARRADLMNVHQYLQMRRDAFANDGVTPTVANAPDLLSWDSTKTTDWQNLLFGRTAHFNDAQVSLSGGTNLARILFNTGYHDENTIYAPSDMGDRRLATRLNADLSSSDMKLNMNTTVSYSVNETDLPGSNGAQAAFSLPPNYSLLGPNGLPNWNSGIAYPLAFLNISSKNKSHTIIANSALRYNVLPGLEIRTSFGYSRRTSDQQSLTPLTAQNPASAVSSSRFANNYTESYIIEPQIDYKLNRGLSQFAVLVGGTLQQNRNENLALTATGFSSDALLANITAAGSLTVAANTSAEYRYNSAFSRLSYNWDKKYIANVTFRRDGSSRFGPAKRFGNFGALGVGWIFSEETFIKKALPFLSFGKLRGSYGITGNDQIGDYQYLSTYNAGTAYQGVGSLVANSVTNQDFGWEENRKMELATELGFLKDRISLTASYYRNRSSNSLVYYPLPWTSGFGSYQANLPALVQNKGWEFLLNTTNISSRDFRWESSFNISFNRNKLLSFPGLEKTAYASLDAVGSSLYRSKYLHFQGVDPATGLAKFEDVNKDGIISLYGTSTDLKFVDNDLNSFYGGLNNTITYKRFRLDFLFSFVKRKGVNSFVNGVVPGSLYNQQTAVLGYWKKPGDITNIPKPSATAGQPGNTSYSNWLLSDALYGDASYAKLKNLSLSYALPSALLNKLRIKRLDLIARGENLFSITGYKVLDPETGNLVVPPATVVTVGINCQF